MKSIKIYGERNSGTIYLEWLLTNNFEIEIANTPDLGWKHRIAPQEDELNEKAKKEVIFLCLVKNPYSWLLSLHKRPYNHEELRKLPFSDFLKYSFGDYRNPIIMWNLKYNSYLKMQHYVDNIEFIKYEDLLEDSKSLLINFANKYGLAVPALYKNINNLLTNSHGIINQKFHKDFYLEEKWRKNLRAHHIDYINSIVDKSLMEKFNYTIL